MYKNDIIELKFRPEAFDKIESAEQRLQNEAEFLMSLQDLGCKTARELLGFVAAKHNQSMTEDDYWNFAVEKKEILIKGNISYLISMPFVTSRAVSFKLVN